MPKNEVNLRAADVKLRAMPLTRSLLKQSRRLTSLPNDFMERDAEGKVTGNVGQEYCIGYVHGSVLQEEHGFFILFVKNGDLFRYMHYDTGSFFKNHGWMRRIYIP